MAGYRGYWRGWAAVLLAAAVLSACAPAAESRPAQTPPAGSSGETREETSRSAEEPPVSGQTGDSGQTGESAPSLGESASEPASPRAARPLTWWQEALSPEKMAGPDQGTGTQCCGYDDGEKLSWPALGVLSSAPQGAGGAYQTDLITRTAVETEDLGEAVEPRCFFEIQFADDTKVTGRFFEKGIELTRSLPGEGYGETVKLAVDPADCALIREGIAAARINGNWQNPQEEARPLIAWKPSWLTMMRESRISRITFTDRDGESRTYVGDEVLWYMADDLVVSVTGPGTATDVRSLPDAEMAHVVFNNDLEYWIYVNDQNTLVVASDAGGMLYPSDRPARAYVHYAAGELNPPTG